MIGLAIDPGTTSIGYTFFKLSENRLTFLDYGSFKASSHKKIEIRLHQIFTQLKHWFFEYPIEILVSEQSFSNPKMAGGGDAVRESLGVIKVVAVENQVPILLLRPQDSKFAVTGKLMATKIEVAEGVERLNISLPFPPKELIQKKQDHISDSIALAIAFAFTVHPEIAIYDKKGEWLCGYTKPISKKKSKKNSTTTNMKRKSQKKKDQEKKDAKKEKKDKNLTISNQKKSSLVTTKKRMKKNQDPA